MYMKSQQYNFRHQRLSQTSRSLISSFIRGRQHVSYTYKNLVYLFICDDAPIERIMSSNEEEEIEFDDSTDGLMHSLDTTYAMFVSMNYTVFQKVWCRRFCNNFIYC